MSYSRVFAFCLLFSALLSSAAFADFQVEVGEAPFDNLALTVSSIKSAQSSIFLNIYEMTSPEIADALIAKIQAGVSVQILEEGQPVGGMSAAEKGIEAELIQAMQQAGSRNHFFVMTSKGASAKRRYRFDHAKYIVIDDSSLLIGSENYSPTGNPVPGTKGNRGWEVLLHDQGIALEYKQIFLGDAVVEKGDVIDATGGQESPQTGTMGRKPKPVPPSEPSQAPSFSASQVQRITSPDTSLSGLVGLIDQAQSSIDIQQMTFDSAWTGGSNPLISSIEKAAQRGVKVRVLLNDEAVFNHSSNPSPSKNLPTIEALNKLTNVSARTANLKAMGVDYIHNKGMLVDGNITLISSINWDENSIQHNREAAVAISSASVNGHYKALFESDWQVSGGGVSGDIASRFSAFTFDRSQSLDCPNMLGLTLAIGKLRLDSDDESFGSIQDSKIVGNFARVASREGCVLASNEVAIDRSSRIYLEVKLVRGGDYGLVIEGYTPKGNKLYSVRAKAGKESNLSGSFEGTVYNGSAAHEYLGKATVGLIRKD